MKKTLSLLLAMIVTLSVTAVGAEAAKLPAKQVPSIICLDREYNFLSTEECKAIKTSNEHGAIIRGDDSLWTFGSNAYGQLGIGDVRLAYNAPVKVMENVESVDVMDRDTIVITKDGALWAFGKNFGSTPQKIMDGIKDAYSTSNGFFAYVDKSGTVYEKAGDNDIEIAKNAKKVFIDTGETLDKRTSHHVIVLHNDGTLYDYPVGLYWNMKTPVLLAEGIEEAEKHLFNGYYVFNLKKNDGTYIYGRYSDLKTFNDKSYKEVNYDGIYLWGLKEDNTLWDIEHNVKIADDVKLFSSIQLCAAIVIHNDNTISVEGNPDSKYFNQLKKAFNAVNNYKTPKNSPAMYEDVYQKTMEIAGGETDKYTQVRLVVKWIDDNVVYEHSGHDQSGVAAFREGSGVCAAFADLTKIMLGYLDIPCIYVSGTFIGNRHAWNLATIDGVTSFIDNTGGQANSFDISFMSYEITSDMYDRKTCDAWASTEVSGAYDYGLIDMSLPYLYTEPITRSNFCSLVRSVIEKSSGKTVESFVSDAGRADVGIPFTDTSDRSVLALYRLGIINGKSESGFAPEDKLTREEAAKILRGLAEVMGDDTAAPSASFPDSDKISPWAADSVAFVAHKGIMNGKTNGFAPGDTLSVQECIVICYRYFADLIS